MSGCMALVVAAGSGSRLNARLKGASLPKQYALLAGQPMLRGAVEGLLAAPSIDSVRVVIGSGQADLYAAALAGLDLPPPVVGGATRQASVRLGLEAMALDPPERVLVHDAARPLASVALIERVCSALATAEAVLPIVPVVDTLKRIDTAGVVQEEVPREHLGRAQTPQGFRFATLLQAHRRHLDRVCTDDTGIVALDGVKIATVPGEEGNFKVTTPDDLVRAEAALANRPRRFVSAMGFDVHAFAAGRRLMLAGIEVPHDRGLAGHSDADVALHAVTDALLGSIADGDIGSHFPPSDPRWRDAASDQFLVFAAERVRQNGGLIEHVDLTIIGERPKIGPRREAMRCRLAELLAVDVSAVSVKATTTEHLGFCGREEGLAAQAIICVSFSR